MTHLYRILRLIIIALICIASTLFLCITFIMFPLLRKKEQPKRIVIGIHEIANIIYTSGTLFQKAGYTVTTVTIQPYFYSKNSYDIIVPSLSIRGLLKRSFIFYTLIFKNDIFYYVWSDTLLPFHLDYFILKALKKTILIQHCGSDVRFDTWQKTIEETEFGKSYVQVDPTQTNSMFFNVLLNQRIPEILNIPIMTLKSQATFQMKVAYPFKITQPMVCHHHHNLSSEPPLIVHAPSSPAVKRTDIVLEAIKNLKKEGYNFDFELITDKKNDDVIKMLMKADIVIDQPSPWIGKLAIEAMAARCIVFSGNQYQLQGFHEPSPAFQFEPNADTLVQDLIPLLKDPTLRDTVANQSYLYWQQHYAPENYVNYLENIFFARSKPTIMPYDHIAQKLYDLAETPKQKLYLFFLCKLWEK